MNKENVIEIRCKKCNKLMMEYFVCGDDSAVALQNIGIKGYLYHYDAQVLNSMMESFVSWEDRPMACSMDICVTKDGRTLLVEFNDAYSLGAYGLADIYYAKLISARWSQLLGVKDEYHF